MSSIEQDYYLVASSEGATGEVRLTTSFLASAMLETRPFIDGNV